MTLKSVGHFAIRVNLNNILFIYSLFYFVDSDFHCFCFVFVRLDCNLFRRTSIFRPTFNYSREKLVLTKKSWPIFLENNSFNQKQSENFFQKNNPCNKVFLHIFVKLLFVRKTRMHSSCNCCALEKR